MYRKGHLVDVIDATHSQYLFNNVEIQKVNMTKPFVTQHEFGELYQFDLVTDLLELIVIEDSQIGIEYKDGLFSRVLLPGRYGYWNSIVEYRIESYNMDDVTIPESLSRKILNKVLMRPFVVCWKVSSYEKALLYIGGEYVSPLDPGTYYFWKSDNKIVEVKGVDLRSQQVEISGQEILTKDKAAIRVNFDVQYKVVDILKALVETKDATRQLYTLVQLALREYIGTMTLDEILSRKEEVAPFVLSKVSIRLEDLGLEMMSCGMRDIILPGDVKAIINQVLIAQKKAQANNIMRQEETAATRSLLNTAKLMEQNSMLYKLKELEFVERIADKVGEITVNGNGEVLSQLQGLFGSSKN